MSEVRLVKVTRTWKMQKNLVGRTGYENVV